MKAQNLLLEIGCEELPASFVEPALSYLKEKISEKLNENYLSFSSVETFGTPRRLIVLAYDVPEVQPDREELIVGPSERAAFDENGNPTKAAVGFAKSKGVDVSQLTVVENPPGRKGRYVAVKRTVKGRKAVDVLREILPDLITSIPFKKSMRWGTKRVRFARPIRWITAVYGKEPIKFEIDGIRSSNVSFGHRFLSPEPFLVDDPSEFISQLEERFVVADVEKRKAIILDGAKDLAERVGGELLEDEELLEEVTNLVEFPYPILGSFEEEFLELPKEVPVVVMKDHQKFFSVVDKEGNLKNYFIGVSNVKPVDDITVRLGYEKVLRARLSDAHFFFKEDRKKTLEERVKDLSGIVFHDKLGTMLDKTKRLESLAPFVSRTLGFDKEEKSKRAAHLCKADLLTEMVNEFPELQGTMGKYYALLDGEDEEVAVAIEEHYLPRFSGDRVAETETGISLSLSEKVDNLTGFIGAGLKPTGSADPFALRRNALGLISTLIDREISVSLTPIVEEAESLYRKQGIDLSPNTVPETVDFIKERLKNYLREKGFSPDSIDAVLSVSDDPYDSLLRVEAIEKLRQNPEFEAVLYTMRRVANIIPSGFQVSDKTLIEKLSEFYLKELKSNPSLANFVVVYSVSGIDILSLEQMLRDELTDKRDRELIIEFVLLNAFKQVKRNFDQHIDRKNYEEALLEIEKLKPYVDLFFDNVMVMDRDEKVRNRRLSLLKSIADHLLKLADFSKLVF